MGDGLSSSLWCSTCEDIWSHYNTLCYLLHILYCTCLCIRCVQYVMGSCTALPLTHHFLTRLYFSRELRYILVCESSRTQDEIHCLISVGRLFSFVYISLFSSFTVFTSSKTNSPLCNLFLVFILSCPSFALSDASYIFGTLVTVHLLPFSLICLLCVSISPFLPSSLVLSLCVTWLSSTRQEDSESLWQLTCGNFPSLMTRNVPITSPDVSLPIRH